MYYGATFVMVKKLRRITYQKHPEDPKIWISNPIKLRKKTINTIIDWHTFTFVIMDKRGNVIFNGVKTGENYEALLRRVKRTLIKLGARIEKRTVDNPTTSGKNSGTSTEKLPDGSST
jgi:hypothetical protein